MMTRMKSEGGEKAIVYSPERAHLSGAALAANCLATCTPFYLLSPSTCTLPGLLGQYKSDLSFR